MHRNNLELRPAEVRFVGVGARPVVRRYLDFVVDGVSLWETVGRPERVTGLGWLDRTYTDLFLDRLLLRPVRAGLSVPLEGGRVPLYICRECGDDIYCDAVTAVVEQGGDTVIWRDFGYQQFPEAEWVDRSGMQAVGPFVFEKEAYTRVLEGAREGTRPLQVGD